MLSFWYNNCGGKNKNQFTDMAMMYIVNKINSRQIVDIRFIFKGHTFLPNDSYLGSIKKKIEPKELLYSMEDYVEAIGQCHSYKKKNKEEKRG